MARLSRFDQMQRKRIKTTKERRGNDYFSKQGKKGAQKRWGGMNNPL